ncbi:MAG: MBL fold metallo-hydrolase [Planctomycetia bacterium]|nr:MBL fold metallo-hydrolase [Planctomycetia bacterium]
MIENIPLAEGEVQRIDVEDGSRIYRIGARVLPHLMGSVYLILSDRFGPTLIDAGSGNPECIAQIEAGFSKINAQYEPFGTEKLERLLLTHAHFDHFGGVHHFYRQSGAEIWIHAFESRIVCSYNEMAVISDRRFAWFLTNNGVLEEDAPEIIKAFGFVPGRAQSAPVSRLLEGGETIDGFRFYHFPGHSSGHLGIQYGDYLFSGDLLLSQTLTQIWPERITPHTGLTHYMHSIDRLDQLAQSHEKETGRKLIALPGHEEILQNIPARIAIVEKSEKRRNDRLLEILRRSEEPLSLYEISKKMYFTTHVNRALFSICDVGSRMEYLQQRGRVAVVNYDSIPMIGSAVLKFAAVD